MHVLNATMFYDIYINIAVYFERKWQVHASAPKWRTLSLVAKLGATVIFNRISRVDVNISLEELFRSNIEDRGNDVKLVKVKVGEKRGGPWSDIDGSETVQSCKHIQLRCIRWNSNISQLKLKVSKTRKTLYPKSDKVLYTILFRHNTYDRQHIHMTDNKYYWKCVFNPCFVKWIYIWGD